MKYQINNKIQKEWNGKTFTEATLRDEADNEFKVSAWAGEFSGDVFEGEIEKNEKGYWRLKKAKLERPNFMKAKEAVIEKAVERKEQSISKFQDSKELSIKMASTLRMAVDMTLAMAPEQRETTYEETIRKWREWFWLEWENISNFKPF